MNKQCTRCNHHRHNLSAIQRGHAEAMEFTTTEKGRRKVIRNGFMYVFQKTLANDVSSWECVLRRKGQCKARIKLSVSQTNCEAVKVEASIKRRAETTADPSRQILADELSAISQTAAVNLPSMDNLRHNIRAVRQERNLPPLPLNRTAIPVLPQQYQVTENGDQVSSF